MFDRLLQETLTNLSTVHAMIETNDRLRRIIFTEDSVRQNLEKNQEFAELIKVTPKEIDWKIYDHCATVTRLYAIYESFVEEIIQEWLKTLPKLVSSYSDLEDKIQNTHREGIGRLLLELKKNRYEHLSVETVVQGFLSGITNDEPYELLPEAFLMYEHNLRKDELNKLFAKTGIENAWHWIDNYRKMKQFVQEIAGDQITAEEKLKQLVDDRNEAAHGSVSIARILGHQDLLDLTYFVTALCEALAELVSYHIICRKELIKKAKKIGAITEWYKQPKAAIAKITDISLSLGSKIWLVSEASSYCQLVTIESIQLNSVSKQAIIINSETEIGLKFNTDARKGLSIYTIEESIRK